MSCWLTARTRAAKNATKIIPIVMANSGDAVATGLIDGLAKPGGNLTGSTTFSPEMSVKRLELLSEAIPSLRQVGVLMNPYNPINDKVRTMMETRPRFSVSIWSYSRLKEPRNLAQPSPRWPHTT
jgi:ABC-type uncharacterized transport system substrate-binding protein